jgi:hypothetical protein
MKNLKLCLILAALLLSGCCGFKERVKGFVGVSTKVLEDNRVSAVKKEFPYDLVTAHVKIKAILRDYVYQVDGIEEESAGKGGKVYIYSDDLQIDLIACYLSETDTTPVGIFLTETSKDKTLVEVSSPSTYAKEFVAKFLFTQLDVSLQPKKVKKVQNG